MQSISIWFKSFATVGKVTTHMKAVGFDLVGTLCKAGTQEEECIRALWLELGHHGVRVPYLEFAEAHNRAALKYLEIRKFTHREVNNRVWIAEALNTLGFSLEEDNEITCRAADAYFRPYVEKIWVPSYVPSILSRIKSRFKLGLITNFTYAAAARSILQTNNLEDFFDSIVVSDEVGWRKPHPNIFRKFLNDVSANPAESFFVGDDVRYDVIGSKRVGMKAILLQSEDTKFSESYYATEEEQDSKPDAVLKSLYDVRDHLLSTAT